MKKMIGAGASVLVACWAAVAEEAEEVLQPTVDSVAVAVAVDASAAPKPDPAALVNGANAMMRQAPKLRAGSVLAKEMKAWKREHRVSIGALRNGAVYLEGTATVHENVQSPQFVMARSAAYEEAYLDALSGYVMDKSGRTSFATASRYFNDGSSDAQTPPKDMADAVARIAKKTAQLTEAKLDQCLRSMNVPVQDFADKDVVAKRQLFVQSLVTESVDQALDSAAGVSVVASFEGHDDKGRYAVGVILRGGTDTEVIAECLRAKKRPFMVRPECAVPVEELLPPEEDIAQEFGVRVVFDPQGVPALLSFGQYGSDYTGQDEDEEEDFEKLAIEQAEGQANDLLTMFINSQITLVNRRARGGSRERVLKFDANGIPTKQSIKAYVNKVTKETSVTGRDTMIGRSTLFRQVVDHPSGHRVAVVVRMWSFDQFEAMSAIKERPRRPAPPPAARKAAPRGNAGSRRSRTYDF